MKWTIGLSLILAVSWLTGSLTLSYAQSPAKADAPTFYHLVPGTYVNGWPRFTIQYPKDWVEVRPRPDQLFRASAPGPAHDRQFWVAAGGSTTPLNKTADYFLKLWSSIGTDAAVVSDKPSRLRDGTPAQEVEYRFVLGGVPVNIMVLAMTRSGTITYTFVESRDAKIGEDLRAILYSVEFQPGFDEPVKLPPDVQTFLDEYCRANVAHDMEKGMSYWSDRYLYSGMRKGEIERYLKPGIDRITSFEMIITDFIPAGDTAYLTGYASGNLGKGGSLLNTMIIKENGQWRWYGNQRDAAP